MEILDFKQFNLGIFECDRKDFELNNVEAGIILDKTEKFINGCISEITSIKEDMKELLNKFENIKYKLEESETTISNGYKGNIDLKISQLKQDESNIKEQIKKCENIINQLPSTEDNLINIKERINFAKTKLQEVTNTPSQENIFFFRGIPYKT